MLSTFVWPNPSPIIFENLATATVKNFLKALYRFVVSNIEYSFYPGFRWIQEASDDFGYKCYRLRCHDLAFSFLCFGFLRTPMPSYSLELVYSCQYFFSAAFYPITNVWFWISLCKILKSKDLYGRQRLFRSSRPSHFYPAVGSDQHWVWKLFWISVFDNFVLFRSKKQTVRNEHNMKDINLKLIDEALMTRIPFSSNILEVTN